MSNRRQLLLSQLKNNLDIVSRAIGLDKNKASSAEKPAEPARFEPDSSSSIAYNVNKDQDFADTETRGQASNRAPPFHTDHYPRHAASNNGTAGVRDDAHDHRSSYDDQYSTHRERTALFPASANDIDSEDAFLYGSRLPEPKSHAPASGYPGSNIRQETGDDLMNKINFLLHGGSTASAKKLPATSDDMQVDPYAPQISIKSHVYNSEPKRTAYHPSSAASQDSDETVDRILKTIGLDGRINDMVQGLIRKDSQSARSSQALPQLTIAPPMSANSIPNQIPPVAANSGSNQMNWDRATQQFLNKMSYASMGEMPREPEIPFAFQYPPPPNWNNQKETKLPDSSGGLETRLYFKAKPEGTALPGLSYRQNDSSAGRAMSETLSNIKALEEALAGLNQSKTSLMLRPPGSQRDSMMLENMRMQEELSGQILTLRDTARDLSQQMKNQTTVASSIPPGSATQQSDIVMKNSPTSFASQPTEEPLREPSTSKHSDRVSTDRKSRSRSHSRDKKKHRSSRSRSRSRDRRRTRGSRRHSRSRSRSRDGYRRRTRNRSRSRDRSRSRNRSRSRERRRSRDRMLSDADRKALGFGTSARKALEAKSEAKSVAQKAEDKEKKALEMALAMYVGAAEYYNGTNIWCQKCDVIFSDVFGLCQHLHSEMHQAKVDPDFNKPRPPYAPVIPPGVPSAPSRGYEFVLPLQAFFCSLCCEFSKDINKAEEHVKSAEHNKKFKQFVTDNSGYELKFLKDVMMAIARSKVVAQDDPPPSQPTTDPKPDAAAAGGIVAADPKKYSSAFLNPEDDSKRETREKFQIKFTGALKQGSTTTKVASKSPDVEIVKVTTSVEARKTSAALAASTANKIVMAKKLPGKTEFSRPSGWVLRADAHSKPPPSAYPPKNVPVSPASLSSPKTPLNSDKPKGPTLDIFSPDSPKTTSTPFSKSTGGRLQTTTVTVPWSGTVSAKKSEEAVLNIGDFEIFDEC